MTGRPSERRGGQSRIGQPGGIGAAIIGYIDREGGDRRAAGGIGAGPGDVELRERSRRGEGHNDVRQAVPASMVLKICGVFIGGWVSNVTVAWASMTVPGRVGLSWP